MKNKMDVPWYMKIRIALGLLLTLGCLYIVFALGVKDTRDLLPNDQNPLWKVLLVTCMIAAILIFCWETKREKEEADSAEPITQNAVRVTSRAAHIRPSPNKRSKYVMIAMQNDLLQGMETKNWVPILWDDRACWIREKDICQTSTDASSVIVKVAVDSTHIRTGPGEDFSSVQTARRGDAVLLMETKDWTPVLIDGAVYWVSKNDTEAWETPTA